MHVVRSAAAASALCLGLLFPATDALAAQGTASQLPPNDPALYSSSVELSKVISTMDFSMPSSYDNLSAPVASGTDELTTTSNAAVPKVATNLRAGGMETTKTTSSASSSSNSNTAASKKKKPAQKSEKKSDPAPSGLSRKEEAAAKKADRVAQREAEEADQAARDAEAAKDRDENIRAARLEKIAARETARADEAAAAAEKGGAKSQFSGDKTMDTSMPSF